MATRLSTELKTAKAQAVADEFNSSGTTLKIYTGTQPASADDAASGTLLVTITLPNPCFGTASSDAISKTGTWSGTASATGTAGWFRLESAGADVLDGACGAGSGELDLSSTSITSGGVVTINTATFTVN